MTFGRLYAESEITVMHACGLGKSVLLKAALLLGLLTAAVAAVNSLWLGPWSSRHQEVVMAEARANPGMATLVEGQFQSAQGGNAVLFVGNVQGKEFEHVFLAQLRPRGNARPSVVVADRGHVTQNDDGNQVVTLDNGARYEGTALLRDFRITDFTNYQAVIGHQSVTLDSSAVEQMDMPTLWRSDSHDARAEFHWRLTLIVSVLLMAVMVVPLSVVNPRQGRVLSMLPAMLLYLVFFLLQSSLRSNASKGKIDPMIWIWMTNLVYFGIAVLLNIWDTVPMRKIRSRLTLRGAA